MRYESAQLARGSRSEKERRTWRSFVLTTDPCIDERRSGRPSGYQAGQVWLEGGTAGCCRRDRRDVIVDVVEAVLGNYLLRLHLRVPVRTARVRDWVAVHYRQVIGIAQHLADSGAEAPARACDAELRPSVFVAAAAGCAAATIDHAANMRQVDVDPTQRRCVAAEPVVATDLVAPKARRTEVHIEGSRQHLRLQHRIAGAATASSRANHVGNVSCDLPA